MSDNPAFLKDAMLAEIERQTKVYISLIEASLRAGREHFGKAEPMAGVLGLACVLGRTIAEAPAELRERIMGDALIGVDEAFKIAATVFDGRAEQ